MCAQKRRRTVAIVDDDAGMLKALTALLDAHGFETNAFRSARDWLDGGASLQCDCLLLDIHLGGTSGIDLQRQLRASGSNLPVVFMTAFDDAAVAAQAAGCVVCLRKPFSPHDLIEAIESASP